MYLDVLGWQQVLSSSFTVQFHAQRHQKLSISENDKTLWRHCDAIQNAYNHQTFLKHCLGIHLKLCRAQCPRKGGATLCPPSGSWDIRWASVLDYSPGYPWYSARDQSCQFTRLRPLIFRSILELIVYWTEVPASLWYSWTYKICHITRLHFRCHLLMAFDGQVCSEPPVFARAARWNFY